MIVALDIATNTGVAVGSPGRAPRAYSVDLGKGQSEDARFSRVLQLTAELIAEHHPAFLAIEAPVGGPQTSHLLVGLVACVRGCAANRGVDVRSYHSGAVRKHFLGRVPVARDFPGMSKGAQKTAIKALVMDRCRILGWQVTDHDAADAAALWDYACAKGGARPAHDGDLFLEARP